MRVAIGSGISGLAAAWLLSLDPARFTVTVFESGAYAGHTNTGVDLVQSDMSFAVSRNNGQFEWCGDSLDTVFVQRSNLIPLMQPGGGIYRMLWDCLRFHRHANKLAADADSAVFGEDDYQAILVNPLATITLGDFFQHNYSTFFYENYILPMTAAIWSSPAGIAFDQFHCSLWFDLCATIMLQIGGRPKWRTVAGGSGIVRLTQPNATTPVVLTDQQGQRTHLMPKRKRHGLLELSNYVGYRVKVTEHVSNILDESSKPFHECKSMPCTISAQESLNEIQNQFATSFCGAWTNYGFHEDGCIWSTGCNLTWCDMSLSSVSEWRVSNTARAFTTTSSLGRTGLERYQAPLPRYLQPIRDPSWISAEKS
ncbi:hypothetical protein BSLG_008104 [Batrachochytrium salamandrivorans]|nr:hypothetical protein BSLG_008104 [Batrachochytrium salamandrivorans]